MQIIKTAVSNDNTKKYYFKLPNATNSHIEACLLYLLRYGYIICISSQIGCSQSCKFCAAGCSKFVRDLSSEEIQQQINLIIEDNPNLKHEKFQITYMGAGEPLDNYKQVFYSIDVLRNKLSNLSKVNISTTCPISARACFESIDWNKYKDFIHFQYSLHFSSDIDRQNFLCSKLMPISEALDCLNHISNIINDHYKINYIPFNNLNDNDMCIYKLAEITQRAPNAILKISQMCIIEKSSLQPSKSFNDFAKKIKNLIPNAEIFASNGTDINAGCGQFYNESIC